MTRVLVVEDEESFSDALSYMLRKEGFEVEVCPTGPDALDAFEPFSSRELVARIRAVLRRQGDTEEAPTATLEAGPVRMDVDRHVVTVRGNQVQLPLKEFELLEVLLRNADRVLTRMQLIDRVWGVDYVGDTKTLDVHVKRLRAKVELDPASPRHIVTVRGLGYKFESTG